MATKAKHAFGSSANVDAALAAGTIDAYDLLFLDGATDPKIGWIDKNGQKVIVSGSGDGKRYVVTVEGDSLPATGEEGIIYIFNDEGYVWNGAQFVALAKNADLTALEAEIATKVDTSAVESVVNEKVETAVSSAIGIVEF